MERSELQVGRRTDELMAACRRSGVKLTHQRLEIFREIAGSLDHPDADAVFRAVQRRVPTVSLDTVYRTLWMLRDLGLVKTLGPQRDAVRFDANLDRHHHYVCVRRPRIRRATGSRWCSAFPSAYGSIPARANRPCASA